MRYFSDNIKFTNEDLNMYDLGEYDQLESKYLLKKQ
jgi:hypothetical protein